LKDERGSRDGASHSEEAQREGLEGGPSFTGDPGRYVINAKGMAISIGANLQLGRTWNLEGGSYTGDFERL
jgi:hypothetical protein